MYCTVHDSVSTKFENVITIATWKRKNNFGLTDHSRVQQHHGYREYRHRLHRGFSLRRPYAGALVANSPQSAQNSFPRPLRRFTRRRPNGHLYTRVKTSNCKNAGKNERRSSQRNLCDLLFFFFIFSFLISRRHQTHRTRFTAERSRGGEGG